jgi:hypothetical protein
MSEWDRYATAVYTGLRDGAVDRATAFDLACLVLEYFPLSQAARELAEASLADGDERRLTEAARSFLAAERFEPGFDLEPGLLTTLERAMEAVNADMRATGLPGTGRLVFPQWDWSPYNAFVVTWADDFGSTSGIFPQEGRDPVTALVAVAYHAQDALMETLREAWPVCPAHQIGMCAKPRDGAAVWWCDGAGGHVAAPIGQWDQRPPGRDRRGTRWA